MTSFKSKLTILIIFVLLIPVISKAQRIISLSANWHTVREVKELQQKATRPILILFYDPANDSSNLFIQNIFSQRTVIDYMNSAYYAIKFDVTTDSVINYFDNNTYSKKPGNHYHDLVTKLTGDKPVLPTLVLYNRNAKGYTFSDFKNPDDLVCILTFIAENIDLTTEFNTWTKEFKQAYFPEKDTTDTQDSIHWMSLKDALAANKENPKYMYINWYTSWSTACNVMLHNAFDDKYIARFMNEYFYCVRLDAQTKDTLFWGKEYINENKPHHYHQMVLAMLEGKLSFPAHIFFDKEGQLIQHDQVFLSKPDFYMLANFIATGSYKTMKVNEYRKTFYAPPKAEEQKN
jgi:thioredoxin-related protein